MEEICRQFYMNLFESGVDVGHLKFTLPSKAVFVLVNEVRHHILPTKSGKAPSNKIAKKALFGTWLKQDLTRTISTSRLAQKKEGRRRPFMGRGTVKGEGYSWGGGGTWPTYLPKLSFYLFHCVDWSAFFLFFTCCFIQFSLRGCFLVYLLFPWRFYAFFLPACSSGFFLVFFWF